MLTPIALAVKNLCITFDSLKTLQSSLRVHGGTSSRNSADTQIHGYKHPSYKMMLNNAYNQSSMSVDSQLQIKNTVFDPGLDEAKDVKSKDTESQLYICSKISIYK